MKPDEQAIMNRRYFLKTASIGLGGIISNPLPGFAAKGDGERTSADGGFKVGLQSFSLRHFDLAGCLQRMKQLGFRNVETYSGHMQISNDPGTIAKFKETLGRYDMTCTGIFVDKFGSTVESNRDTFLFARAMGIPVLVGTPTRESFESLDRLVGEFRIPVAIHNHGPGSIYATIDDVSKALEGRHELIGVCVDTGHFLRSDQDPVKAIQTFGARTYGMHLKDVDKDKKFPVLGKGTLDTVGVLRALKQVKFKYCLAVEYEEKPENPMADIEECLQVMRQAVNKV
jgi:inosose dehydratase